MIALLQNTQMLLDCSFLLFYLCWSAHTQRHLVANHKNEALRLDAIAPCGRGGGHGAMQTDSRALVTGRGVLTFSNCALRGLQACK